VIDTDCEKWDNGRVLIKKRWAPSFEKQGLTTFDKLKSVSADEIAKAARSDRWTSRFTVPHVKGYSQAFYLKWHGASPWKDIIKPLLQFKKPIVGAVNEWNAMHWFARARISSMEPVAVGKSGSETLVVSRSIEKGIKLSDWVKTDPDPMMIDSVMRKLASMTRQMHQAGLCHQDFYLGHVIKVDQLEQVSGIWRPWEIQTDASDSYDGFKLYIIDLGRVMKFSKLPERWMIKDLAQLNYSARDLPASSRGAYAHQYFETEHFNAEQKHLMTQILHKCERIAQHSRKHRLS
jgi:heptose I phosphotransferase